MTPLRLISTVTLGQGRYLATMMLWWDHVVEFIHRQFGPAFPIVALGASWGGYHTLQLAANKFSTLGAFIAIIPATIVSNASQFWVNPINFGPTPYTDGSGVVRAGCPGGTAGMDVGPHALDAMGNNSLGVPIPGMVSYGNIDPAVGYSSTTLAAGNSADVSTFTGSGVLHVVDSTQITQGEGTSPGIEIPTTTGMARLVCTGTGSNTLTGCTTQVGTGVPTLGGAVTQSNTLAIIANANLAGQQVTGHEQTGEGHQFTVTGALAWADYLASLDSMFPKVH